MVCLSHNLKYQNLFRDLLQCFYKYYLLLCIQWNVLYQYNTVLLFCFIFWFYIIIGKLTIIVSEVVYRQVYACIFQLFSLLLQTKFQKLTFLYNSLVLIHPSSISCYKLYISMFCFDSMVFPETTAPYSST